MTGEITSARAGGILAPTTRGQWEMLFAFLKRPALPDRFAGTGASARITLRLYLLDLLVIFGFGVVVLSAEAAGIVLPENLNASFELDAGTIVLFVAAAPVLEEIAFRSWLSGRPATLAALGVLLAGAGGLAVSGTDSLAGPLVALASVLLAIAALIVLRGRPPLRIFKRHFALFFWASSIGFALVHLVNYEEGAIAIKLPLLIPQFVVGTMAGYVRVQCGLAWSMALHAAHNGFAVGMALLALSLAPAG
jgi:hypothetical protein